MSRPRIGITCSANNSTKATPIQQDRLNAAYSRSIYRAGGLPVLLPNLGGEFRDAGAALVAGLDGLLLSGGADVDPALYGEKRRYENVEDEPRRDGGEFAIIRAALADPDLPILGICRGIQTLNVVLGGTLYQDLPSDLGGAFTGLPGATSPLLKHDQTPTPRPQAVHDIDLVEGTRFEDICGARRLAVNSLHHQGIKDLGKGLRVVARSSDGIIEAVEADDPQRYLVAVQYHPEELFDTQVHARLLFESLIAAANARLPF